MFCSTCGKQLREEDRFCSGCGKTVIRENQELQNTEIEMIKEELVEAPIQKTIKESAAVEEKVLGIFNMSGQALRKEYFKWLIIITIIFGLLEVLLVLIMPWDDIHTKVLSTIGLIVVFGLVGLTLITLYEATDENKTSLSALGINVLCFSLSGLLVWDILKADFFSKTMWVLVIILVGLIVVSLFFLSNPTNKYAVIARNVTVGAVYTAITLFSAGIYFPDLYDVDIYERAIWSVSILFFFSIFVSLLLSNLYKSGDDIKEEKKKSKTIVFIVVLILLITVPSILSAITYRSSVANNEVYTKDWNEIENDWNVCKGEPVALHIDMIQSISQQSHFSKKSEDLSILDKKFDFGLVMNASHGSEIYINTEGCNKIRGTVVFDNLGEGMARTEFIINKDGRDNAVKIETFYIQHGETKEFETDISGMRQILIKRYSDWDYLASKLVVGNIYFE